MSESERYTINTFTFTPGKKGVWFGGPNTYLARKIFKEHEGEWNKVKGKWYVRYDEIDQVVDKLKELDFKIHLVKKNKGFYLKGYTYPSRKKIKELGGNWQKDKNGWFFPAILMGEVIANFPELS